MTTDQAKELALTLRATGLYAHVAGDWIIFGGPAAKSGVHSLSISASSADRVLTHWKGFVANNSPEASVESPVAREARWAAENKRALTPASAPRVRRMAVVTFWKNGHRALVEYVKDSTREARVWNVRGQRFNRSYTIDTLYQEKIRAGDTEPRGGIKDTRPATLADLKRFKFTLKPGQTLA